MPQPNTKDLADFARYAIQFSLLDVNSVRRWGDEMIEQLVEPSIWAIDLACATSPNVDDLLKHAPGCSTGDLSARLLCSLLRRRWENIRLTIGEVRSIGWALNTADLLRDSTWGAVVECEGEEFEEGWRTELQMRNSITEKLSHYELYDSLLPWWAT